MSGFLAGLCVAVLPLLASGFWLGRRTARPESLGGLGTPVEHATFETLHTASLAAPPLWICTIIGLALMLWGFWGDDWHPLFQRSKK